MQVKRIHIKGFHIFFKVPLIIFLLLLLPVLLWSMILPKDIGVWTAEAFPVFIAIYILIKTYRDFPLTYFAYISLYIGSFLILVGAHYTYSHVPLFDWIKSVFGLHRNNYDKVGHFFQGFTTAVVVKEYFIRKQLIASKKWINLLTLSFALALSAMYEIIEWLTVMVLILFGSQKDASDFLGAQNYFWDTQTDMFFALIGAAVAIWGFGKYHEKKITT